eukprot:TRINITY_DN9195_c0_g1_i1.p1 TRINITY_DN9195_c0_g1~~TRINITY_DN9195_c0_g1_i1.p1  ORF type:complete len:383 (+),score=102.02 TRINITY_DN9195_c0_g1_i1:76-1149(+)
MSVASAFLASPAVPPAATSALDSRGLTAASLQSSSTPLSSTAAAASSSSSSHSIAGFAVVAAAAFACHRGYQRHASQRQAAQQQRARLQCRALASSEKDKGELSRAELLRRTLPCGAGAAVASGALPAQPALAMNQQEAEKIALDLGLPGLIPPCPQDFQVVAEPVGLKQWAGGFFDLGTEPVLVTFACPNDWVITKPELDFNGSSGTIHADNYAKGDACTLYMETKYKGDINKRADMEAAIERAIKIKAPQVIEDLQVNKVVTIADGYKQYQCDWEIYSGAGFYLRRSGYFTICQVGEDKNLQMLWTAVLGGSRFQEKEDVVRKVTASFRIGKIPTSEARQLVADTQAKIETRSEI